MNKAKIGAMVLACGVMLGGAFSSVGKGYDHVEWKNVETNLGKVTNVLSSKTVTQNIKVAYKQLTSKGNVVLNREYMGVKINADNELEYALANGMLMGATQIDVTNFKEINNMTDVEDYVQKVMFQNPLIMGVTTFGYSTNGVEKKVIVRYAFDKNTLLAKQKAVVSKLNSISLRIFTPKMTDEQKVKAIYDYLEKSSVYDKSALVYANKSMALIPKKFTRFVQRIWING